jgi:predicted RNA-binding protein with PUA-like domain
MTLATIKADARFANFPLVTQGRLSVMPVPAALVTLIRNATGLKG